MKELTENDNFIIQHKIENTIKEYELEHIDSIYDRFLYSVESNLISQDLFLKFLCFFNEDKTYADLFVINYLKDEDKLENTKIIINSDIFKNTIQKKINDLKTSHTGFNVLDLFAFFSEKQKQECLIAMEIVEEANPDRNVISDYLHYLDFYDYFIKNSSKLDFVIRKKLNSYIEDIFNQCYKKDSYFYFKTKLFSYLDGKKIILNDDNLEEYIMNIIHNKRSIVNIDLFLNYISLDKLKTKIIKNNYKYKLFLIYNLSYKETLKNKKILENLFKYLFGFNVEVFIENNSLNLNDFSEIDQLFISSLSNCSIPKSNRIIIFIQNNNLYTIEDSCIHLSSEHKEQIELNYAT